MHLTGWYKLGRFVVFLLGSLTCLAGVTLVAFANAGFANEAPTIREIVTALAVSVVSLAGATAFIFKCWLKRDREWQEAFIQLIQKQSALNDEVSKLVNTIENLSTTVKCRNSQQ